MSASSDIKIAVIGAGILGLLSAYNLMRSDAQVCLYDAQGFDGENASRIAGGMLAPYAEVEHMGGAWIDAGLAGIEFWRGFSDECGGAIEFAQRGSLLVAHDQDRYILERFKAHVMKEAGDQASTVDVSMLEPSLSERFRSALYLEPEAHIHPAKAMDALLAALERGGVGMVAKPAAPETLAKDFDVVIDARGMGAAKNAPDLRAVKGEMALVRNAEFSLSRPVRLMHPRYPLYIVPREDHVFMIGATQVETEGEGVSVRSGMELLSALYSLDKSFGDAEVLSIKSGLRPSFPDNLPRVWQEGSVIGLNGSFRHGYLLSPVMARVACALALGGENAYMDLLMKGGRDESRCQRTGTKV